MALIPPLAGTLDHRPVRHLGGAGTRRRGTAAGDLVRVVAVDQEQRVALQMRHGRLSLPSGSADGEPPRQAAARLLLESTGLLPGHVRNLGVIAPPRDAAAGRTHLLMTADVLVRAGRPHGAEGVVWRPLSEAIAADQAGAIADAASRTGLLLAAMTLSRVLDGARV